MSQLKQLVCDCEKASKAAHRRVQACQGVFSDAVKQKTKAAAKLALASEDEARHAAALESARCGYADDPSDGAAKKVARAREEHELATLRMKRPVEADNDADAAVAAATAALSDAEHDLARASEELEVARLRLEISLPHWLEVSKPLYDAVVDADRAAAAARQAFFAAFEANKKGSEVLREKGIDCAESTPLGLVHLASASALARAEEDPSVSLALTERIVNAVNQMGIDPLCVIDRMTADAGLAPRPDCRHLLVELLSARSPNPFEGPKLVERDSKRKAQEERQRELSRPSKKEVRRNPALVFDESDEPAEVA